MSQYIERYTNTDEMVERALVGINLMFQPYHNPEKKPDITTIEEIFNASKILDLRSSGPKQAISIKAWEPLPNGEVVDEEIVDLKIIGIPLKGQNEEVLSVMGNAKRDETVVILRETWEKAVRTFIFERTLMGRTAFKFDVEYIK